MPRAKAKEEPISKALYQELEVANTQLLKDVVDLKETIKELTPKPNVNPNIGILFIDGMWVKNNESYKTLQEAQNG